MHTERFLEEWVPTCGDVFLDVGAHRGGWSRRLAPRFVSGHAIEPRPALHEALASQVPQAVSVHRWAAWSEAGERTFDACADGRLYGDNPAAVGPGARRSPGQLRLPCRPLDALLPEVVGKVDFVRVDARGAEGPTLIGAQRLIHRDRPWLLIETHSVTNFFWATQLLSYWGYVFTVIRHPDYEPHSPQWRGHCWLAAQPALHDAELDWTEDDVTARSSRRETIRRALIHLDRRRPHSPTIVEVGATRGGDDESPGDGRCTYSFGAYASRHDGRVITVNRSAEALDVCRRVTAPFADHIDTIHADAVQFLKSYRGPLDLLYLGGPDGGDPASDRPAQLDFYGALREPPELILIGDAFGDAFGDASGETDRGQGALLIPRLTADGYRRVFDEDRHALYARPRGFIEPSSDTSGCRSQLAAIDLPAPDKVAQAAPEVSDRSGHPAVAAVAAVAALAARADRPA
jgi:FkbM family methyltransferase